MASYSRFFKVTSIIWALVSDGDQAYIFKYHKDEMVFDEKVFAIRGTQGVHAVSTQSSPRKDDQASRITNEALQNFIPAIAERLQQSVDEKAFDYLVIVAPKDTMNELQDALSESVQRRLLANMPEGYSYDRNGVIYAFRKEEVAAAEALAGTKARSLPPSCTREGPTKAPQRAEQDLEQHIPSAHAGYLSGTGRSYTIQ